MARSPICRAFAQHAEAKPLKVRDGARERKAPTGEGKRSAVATPLLFHVFSRRGDASASYARAMNMQGTTKPSQVMQQKRAVTFWTRGVAFLTAADFLRRENGDRHVMTHLWCQGIELCFKGLLLLKNYKTYSPTIQHMRHDLEVVVDKTFKAYTCATLAGSERRDLLALNEWYKDHRLRYARGIDLVFLPDPPSVTPRLKKRLSGELRAQKKQIERLARHLQAT